MDFITLPGGRRLAYAEYGDPNGKPLFLFHGFPGSRFFRPPLDGLTAAKHVRLITVDRPGYGGSDFQPGRRIVDWPADVSRLADHLRLKRFAVSGHSGGGPYLLACARFIPDRLTAAGMLSGMGPIESVGPRDKLRPLFRFGFVFGRRLPWPVFRLLVYILMAEDGRHPENTVHPNRPNPADPDNAMLAMPGGFEVCRASNVEALRPGLLGHAWEAFNLLRPWGFNLQDISMPVDLWHGTLDEYTPIAMGRAVARLVPNCRGRFLEGEGHLLLFKHWGEMLDALT